MVALLAAILPPSSMLAKDSSGLRTSVAVDIVGEVGASPDAPARDRLEARESELMLYGPIDPTFDGRLAIAAHPESGQTVFEMHEAFLSSSRLIPRSRLRLGHFFLGVGRLNQQHRHDWPFISTPHAHRQFFAEEAASDAGAQVATLLPTPFFLELTLGATSGFTYGHSHVEGERPRVPAHYGRLASFVAGIQAGLNILGRTAADGTASQLVGLDAVFKERDGRVLTRLAQLELWTRTRKPTTGDSERAIGGYLYGQVGLTSAWSVGLRLDGYSVLTTKDAAGDAVTNRRVALVPQLRWQSSEFSRFALAVRAHEDQLGDETTSYQVVETQATFFLGAHPAHDY